jgi:hypothetical protein
LRRKIHEVIIVIRRFKLNTKASIESWNIMSKRTRVSKVMVWRSFMMMQNVKGKNEG